MRRLYGATFAAVKRLPVRVTRALVVVQSLLLAVLVTWPMPMRPATAVLGSPNGDALKHVWNLWWMNAELRGGEPGLPTTLVNYPEGLELYPIEIANGLVTAWTPLPPVLAANLLAFLHVVLVGLAAGWLGWCLTSRRAGALTAGALAQGSAFTAFTLHAGVGELRLWWWLPLGLACAVQARQRQSARDFVVLGLALAGATLSCFYHGFFLATAVATLALATLRLQPRLLLGYAGAAGLGLLIVVPVIRLFAHTYDPAAGATIEASEGFLAHMARPWPRAAYAVSSLRPLELVSPDLSLTSDPKAPFEAYLGGRYLGAAALLLAMIGLWAQPRRAWPWVAVGAVGAAFALGNTWTTAGHGRWILPLSPVNQALAYVAEPLNFPVRFLAVTTVALAALGAFAASRRGAWVLVPLVLVDVAINDATPWPRNSFYLPFTDSLAAPPGAVADLTWAEDDDLVLAHKAALSTFDAPQRARSAAAQLLLDRPFATVPIERVDHWATGGTAWLSATPLARRLGGGQVAEADLAASGALLRARGFGSVLLTHPCGAGAQHAPEAVLTALFGAPARGRCGSLWTLPDTPAPPGLAELAARVEADAAALPKPTLGSPDAGGASP